VTSEVRESYQPTAGERKSEREREREGGREGGRGGNDDAAFSHAGGALVVIVMQKRVQDVGTRCVRIVVGSQCSEMIVSRKRRERAHALNI